MGFKFNAAQKALFKGLEAGYKKAASGTPVSAQVNTLSRGTSKQFSAAMEKRGAAMQSADFEAKHPRKPAGSPAGTGGEFTKKGREAAVQSTMRLRNQTKEQAAAGMLPKREAAKEVASLNRALEKLGVPRSLHSPKTPSGARAVYKSMVQKQVVRKAKGR